MSTNVLEVVKAELGLRKPSEFQLISFETGIPLGTIRKIHYGEVKDPRISTVQVLYDFFVNTRAVGQQTAANRPGQSEAA